MAPDVIPQPMQEVPALDRAQHRLQAFEYSAELSLLRQGTMQRLSELERELQITFDDDVTFRQRAADQRIYMTPNWLKAVLFASWFVAAIVLSMILLLFTRGAPDTAVYICCIPACAAPLCIYLKWKRDTDERVQEEVQAALRDHQRARQVHMDRLPTLRQEQETLQTQIEQITAMMLSLIRQGGVPQQHWDYAYQLWQLVENGSAESLKEAINCYEEMQWRSSMIGMIHQSQQEMASLQGTISRLHEQQIQLQNELALHEFTDAVRDLMRTISDWSE